MVPTEGANIRATTEKQRRHLFEPWVVVVIVVVVIVVVVSEAD